MTYHELKKLGSDLYIEEEIDPYAKGRDHLF